MNIAIIEDLQEDRLWLSHKIKDYLKQSHQTYSIHEFSCAEDFLASVSSTSYALVFMDIYLNGMSGMDAAVLFRQMDSSCKLVFLTCTADFALQGYSVQASHYLVKPVSDEKFIEAMENCKIQPRYTVPFLNLSECGGPANLDTRQILYITLENRTVHIHTTQQVLSVNSAFRRVTQPLLADNRFILSIQGVLVNMDHISGHSESVFIMKNGTRIPINIRNKKRILQLYRNYVFENMGGEV